MAMFTSRLPMMNLASKCVSPHILPKRAMSTVLSRVIEKRDTEAGPGGRNSNAGVKVAVFGATGFLGRYVCGNLAFFSS